MKSDSLARLSDNYRDTPVEPSWSLPLYLLLPRRNEIVVKGVFLHYLPALVGALFTVGAIGSSGAQFRTALWHATVSFFCFEFLLYQARYTVNDLLGYREDRDHPSSVRPMRLPTLWNDGGRYDFGDQDAVILPRMVAFVLVFLVRISAPFVVVLVLIPELREEFYVAFALAIAFAVVYELIRWSNRHVATRTRVWVRDVVLFLVVAGGYGIRAGLGILIGSEPFESWWMVVGIGVAFYATGMATVLATWTLESSQFIAASAPEVSPGGLLALFRPALEHHAASCNASSGGDPPRRCRDLSATVLAGDDPAPTLDELREALACHLAWSVSDEVRGSLIRRDLLMSKMHPSRWGPTPA